MGEGHNNEYGDRGTGQFTGSGGRDKGRSFLSG
jgi:hypothetical protein